MSLLETLLGGAGNEQPPEKASPASPILGEAGDAGDTSSTNSSNAPALSGAPTKPNAIDGVTFLEIIADAVAANPRAPFLDEIAISRGARSLLEANRALAELTGSACGEALALTQTAARTAARAIVERDYLRAYEILESLPAKLRGLRLN
jgi:hypothetical protein